ncbi:nucleoside recognition domain-containing protein [Paenibacillus assamensis]|uniref:nucleoside recognition domain-containing protein n=1 Tax=Paenibacillus assamensis TaxID=311244 RepID=UPI00042A7F93|nr:nucleoside recognition domain-containing protein [Paenibacillus assamensis]
MRSVRLLRSSPFQHPLYTLFVGASVVLLVVSIMLYPTAAFQASLQGLQVWWTIIFPALLPFLVLSHLLSALGWVHALGVVLEPIMRLLIRVPGVGGWAWALGWTAGYPAGAEVIANLRQQQSVSRREGERLLALAHVSNPVFLVAVVGVGFMKQADVGLLLACIHWITALLTAVFLRIVDGRNKVYTITSFKCVSRSTTVEADQHSTSERTAAPSPKQSFPQRIFNSMEQARQMDGRPIGRLLGEAVSSAVQTLMMIGGYMMMFSVLIQVARLALPSTLGNLLMNGLLEVNLGAFTISSTSFSSPEFQAALVSAVLAWSGISSHLQVHSLIKQTDLRYWRFFAARLLHALLAFICTYVCWKPLLALFRSTAAVAPVWADAASVLPSGIGITAHSHQSSVTLFQSFFEGNIESLWIMIWNSINGMIGAEQYLSFLYVWLQPFVLLLFAGAGLLILTALSCWIYITVPKKQ